jgi:putative flippase GtrA
MDEKKGINIFQRLMNVVFIVWASWFLFLMFMTLKSGELLELTWRDLETEPLLSIITFLGWLLVMAVNYIFNKKVTLWNKREDK